MRASSVARESFSTSAALAAPYEELRTALPEQAQLGIDETGHKDDGKPHWTRCSRARSFILFLIPSTRSSEALQQALDAAFASVINCDYFGAYRKFVKDSSAIMSVGAYGQFCMAHLIRDAKFLAESTDKVTRNWAKRMLKDFENLFRLIHRREQLLAARFQARFERCRDKLIRRFKSAPDRPGLYDLCQRFRLHARQFFTFATTPGIEPTNNLTEQACLCGHLSACVHAQTCAGRPSVTSAAKSPRARAATTASAGPRASGRS